MKNGVAFSMPKKDRMRRHFFLTLHHNPDGTLMPSAQEEIKEFDCQPIIDEIDSIFGTNLRYRRGTLEVGKEGSFHMHFYVELFQSVRWNTVVKKTQHMFVKVKTIESNKELVHDYCGKIDDPTFLAGPFDYGHRRPNRKDEESKSALDEVIDRLLDGNPIKSIAREYPKTWIIYGRRIKDWLQDMGQFSRQTIIAKVED